MVIDHGNFHMEDNDLKFTSTWELADLSKPAEFHLNKSVHFIISRSFKKNTNSEISENFHSIDVLRVSVSSV